MINNSAAYALDPEASVFVSANAGTGKTRLLTSRVLRLLLHGVAPARILCLTFTNAAAAEMMSRVQGELGKWVMADDVALYKVLAELLGQSPDEKTMARARGLFATVLEAPEGVRIQTIHGFCQSLLKRFPVEAAISPNFSVIDARTEQELLQEARLRLFARAQNEDPRLREALAALACSASESSLHDLLDNLLRHKRRLRAWFARRHGVESAVENVWQRLGLARDTTPQSLFETHFTYDENTLAGLRRIAGILSQGSAREQNTGQGLAQWLERPRVEAMADYLALFITEAGTPRKQLFAQKTLTDPVLIALLASEQERACRFADSSRALETATRTSHLLHIAEALLALYDAQKRARAAMDFDDLILTALHVLQRPGISPWVLFKLDGGIDHVLVDEAQDTSPEQWAIVDALTQEFFAGEGRSEEKRPIFVVGDEKQSIFGFQGADPSGLGRMQRYFSGRIRAAAMIVHHIELNHSFRSAPEVLAAVDAVFARPEAKAGLTFDDTALSHVATRLEHPGLVEVWPLFTSEFPPLAGGYRGESAQLRAGKLRSPSLSKPLPQAGGDIAPSTRLARTIADTIRGWLDEGVMLEAKGRPVEAGDIMILVRSRGTLVDRLVRALKRRGVPVAGQDRMRLSDNLAVQDLIALGQALLLPEDNLTLAVLLKTPIFNLDEESLFRLCWNRGKKSVWQRLSEDKNCAQAYALLTDLRARADLMPPYELYTYLLDTLSARRRILGRMGEEYADPIDEFLNQALLYEKSHPPSLQGFLHWLAASDSDIKRDMEQNSGSVRILTVHGAKGLQAPIVILPDTTEPPPPKDKLFWHEDEEGMLCLWPAAKKQDDAFTRRLREAQEQAQMAEYRRLLYVALTRAEDRLYICGATGRKDAREESWYRLVRDGLAGISEKFDMKWGEGLRMGREPTLSPPSSPPLAGGYRGETSFGFLSRPSPIEPTPPRPLAPSRAGDEPAAASPMAEVAVYRRGLLTHTLLQYLPEVAKEERPRVAAHLASGYIKTMAQKEIDGCIHETLAVINDPQFAFLFAEGSLAEVPVAGCVEVGGKTVAVSGQIDRLHIGQKDVWIVDFKSNRAPPGEVPLGYLRQMQLYRLLLQRIYPEKTVHCALLWTAGPRLSVLDHALLDEALAGSYI